MPRRKLTALSKQDSSSGSDDDVVYAGTSSPPWREVIELNDSSSSSASESSDDGVTYKKRPSSISTKQDKSDMKGDVQKNSAPLITKEASKKRKGGLDYDKPCEAKRQKSSPMMASASMGATSQDTTMRSKEPTQMRAWTGIDDVDVSSNNLKHVSPKMHMPLEILDEDYIWSSAKIIKISNSKQKCCVTVRYEGWGSEWDEELTYPNPRLARIYTYTKRVKCLANVLSKKKEIRVIGVNSQMPNNHVRNWTDIWPCTVSLRMPHPGVREESDKLSPEELLRLENNVFVQPYAPQLLSSFLQNSRTCGGWWISTSNLRLWREFDIENPLSKNTKGCVLRELSTSGNAASQQLEYHFHPSFITAWSIAKDDKWVRGCLPPGATPVGSLLDEKYRVKNIGGDAIEGVKYMGSFDMRSASRKQTSETPSRSATPIPPPEIEVAKTQLQNIHEENLPPPILINYEHPGVRRLPNSNRWASVVKIAGNDVFLGSFVSQTEAVRVRESALAQCSDNVASTQTAAALENTSAIGPVHDLLNTPVEAVISAFEESKTKTLAFSLQNWMAVEQTQYFSELQDLLYRKRK